MNDKKTIIKNSEEFTEITERLKRELRRESPEVDKLLKSNIRTIDYIIIESMNKVLEIANAKTLKELE